MRLARRGRVLLAAFLGLAFASAAVPACASEASPVTVRLVAEPAALAIDLVFDIQSGWHIYGPAPKDTGLPTSVTWDLPPGYSAGPLEWPRPERFELAGVESEGYSGKLVLRARIIPPAGASAGDRATIKAKAEWLACKLECMPGSANLELAFPIAAKGAASAGGASAWAALALALLMAFAGGLILNLMPCVLPVLSLKALSLAKAAERGGAARRGSLKQGLWYAAGILVSFWILAALLLALRSGGRAIGWGFQLQDPSFVVAAALAFFLIGLSFFGVFEVGAFLSRAGAKGSGLSAWEGPPLGRPQGRREGLRSFLNGLFATAVATPCTAPFMGPAVAYALSHTAAAAFAVFGALGLGLAAPLLAIAAVPGFARALPKPGAWTLRFRQALGFPMMAAVVWMAYVLGALGGLRPLLALLEGLVPAAIGAWIWGAWGGIDRSGKARIAAGASALVLVAAGLSWALAGAQAGEGRPEPAWTLSPQKPGLAVPGPGTGPGSGQGSQLASKEAFWQPWSEETVADLRRRGISVFVNFTAAWCLSCQVNEAVAFSDSGLRERFAQLGVAVLKADWTARDESVGRALARLGRASVPVYALYVPGKAEPLLLPELLTPSIVSRYLRENLDGQGR
jgi:thiol:disulfide interchange protein